MVLRSIICEPRKKTRNPWAKFEPVFYRQRDECECRAIRMRLCSMQTYRRDVAKDTIFVVCAPPVLYTIDSYYSKLVPGGVSSLSFSLQVNGIPGILQQWLTRFLLCQCPTLPFPSLLCQSPTLPFPSLPVTLCRYAVYNVFPSFVGGKVPPSSVASTMATPPPLRSCPRAAAHATNLRALRTAVAGCTVLSILFQVRWRWNGFCWWR